MMKDTVTSAVDAELVFAPVDAAQVVAGAPTTGETVLSGIGGTEIGIWELTAGAVTDTEVEEISVVVAGSATIGFRGAEGTDAADTVTHSIQVKPGDVIRFAGGERTVWRVADRLRKVYVIEA